MPNDEIIFEILADGTIKADTGKISGPNHLNAANFLRDIAKLAGGPTEVKQKRKQTAHNQSQHLEH